MSDLNATSIAFARGHDYRPDAIADPASPTPDIALDRVRQRPGGRSARTRGLVLDAARAELLESGYADLSHRAVARRAGVDPATVYRRWPTRARLATDALLEIAGGAVPIPDSGRLASDLEAFLQAVAGALADPRLLRLFHALSAAGAEADAELKEILRGFWQARFAGAEAMIGRGIDRGELPRGVDPHETIEQLVSPLYFRALVSGEPVDSEFVQRCVARALLAESQTSGAGSRTKSTPKRS